MTSRGIEPATFRPVAQCPKQVCYRLPPKKRKKKYFLSWPVCSLQRKTNLRRMCEQITTLARQLTKEVRVTVGLLTVISFPSAITSRELKARFAAAVESSVKYILATGNAHRVDGSQLSCY